MCVVSKKNLAIEKEKLQVAMENHGKQYTVDATPQPPPTPVETDRSYKEQIYDQCMIVE